MPDYGYVDVEPVTAIMMTATCTHDQLGPTIARLFGELSQANPEAELVGPPMIYYRDWRPSDCDIEAALPVAEGTMPRSGTTLKTYPACTALISTHTGPYEGLPDAWMGMWRYVEQNGVEVDMPCWDVYVNDPGVEPDPAKWTTELYIPLKKH